MTKHILVNRIEFNMCPIPAGNFLMGSPSSELDRSSDETQHQVTISKSFYMTETAVTQELWVAVMGNNPANFKGAKNPVEHVSWDDCQEFICKLNNLTRQNFRLPTEAEWEYACRAGTTTPFHYGSSLDSSMANFDGNYPYGGGAKGVYREKTTPVKSFKPNTWGLYDMHGNIWEWCADRYGEYSGDATDPVGPDVGSDRVLRGGGWGSNAWICRSANRGGFDPTYWDNHIGFRIVLPLCYQTSDTKSPDKNNQVNGVDFCGTCKKPKIQCTCAKSGIGAKFDMGKLDWTLLPIDALEGTVRVLMHGCAKYDRDNWMHVPDGEQRYMKAMLRHLIALLSGEENDQDSGLPHWDHLMCNTIFISWFKKHKKEIPQ